MRSALGLQVENFNRAEKTRILRRKPADGAFYLVNFQFAHPAGGPFMSSRDTLRIILLTFCIGLGASLQAQPAPCDGDPLSIPHVVETRLPQIAFVGQG
jgi:hypothetical protein